MTLEIILPPSIDLLPFISPILSRVSYDHRDSVLGEKMSQGGGRIKRNPRCDLLILAAVISLRISNVIVLWMYLGVITKFQEMTPFPIFGTQKQVLIAWLGNVWLSREERPSAVNTCSQLMAAPSGSLCQRTIEGEGHQTYGWGENGAHMSPSGTIPPMNICTHVTGE